MSERVLQHNNDSLRSGKIRERRWRFIEDYMSLMPQELSIKL
jgi:hypothetical protein